MNINRFSVKKDQRNRYPVESKNQSVMMRVVNARAKKLKIEALKGSEFNKDKASVSYD